MTTASAVQVRSAVHVRNVTKSFKDVEVLRGVDLDVAEGSIFALLGSNGAGKTTLVRILSTLLRPMAARRRCRGSTLRGSPLTCGSRSV